MRRIYTSLGPAHAFAVAAAMLFLFTVPARSQTLADEDRTVTYTRGQSVVPVYHGWMKNADGSHDLYFSYINRNWQEEVDILVGPDNNISAPYGPDAGQPTHFLPRINRWVFAVRVPPDFGEKEVVWMLTVRGQTHRAYGTLNPGYEVDEFIIQHEYGNSIRGRKRPTLEVEGDVERTAKVGQPLSLVAVATDPNPLLPSSTRRRDDGERRGTARSLSQIGPGPVGGDFTRSTARGLYLGWVKYRGSGRVTFDPPVPFKMWEDQRGGSPWSPGWQPPPVPPGNKWVHNVTFHEPGIYVLRAQVRDGFLFTDRDIIFNVTP